MTRKKLGLGLLETFSEPCDVCGGRGVVVHHEPVSRNRSSESGGSKRKKASAAPATAPHQITDDARQAIAQIAKSTVGVAAKTEPETETSVDDQVKATKPRRKRALGIDTAAVPKILDSVLQALPEPPAKGQSKRRRRASSQDL
jgi:ribonuclease E